MKDQYGNYFCQKLLHNASPDQRIKILKALSKDFVNVSCDDVGTHPMQRLVEMVNQEEERQTIVDAIKDDIVELAFHPKGNYVLLAIIQILKPEKLQTLLEPILCEIFKLS